MSVCIPFVYEFPRFYLFLTHTRTHIHSHAHILQVRISEWMATSRVEVEKWILAEAEEIKAKREKGDAVEAAAKTDAELAEKKVTIRKWQKARRRDARDKLLAALGDEGAP